MTNEYGEDVTTTDDAPVTEPPAEAPTVEAPVDDNGDVVPPATPAPEAGDNGFEVIDTVTETETIEVIPENEKPDEGPGEAVSDLRYGQTDTTEGSVVDDAEGDVVTPAPESDDDSVPPADAVPEG